MIPEPPPDLGPDRRPQTLGGAVYLLVLVAALVGVAISVTGAWRVGVGWVGGSVIVAGLVRLVLPERKAGMLRVRRRASDVVMLLGAGAALVVLAIVVPNQPG